MKTININGKDFTIDELNELIAQKEKESWRDGFKGQWQPYLYSDGGWKPHKMFKEVENRYKTREEAELRAKQIALFCDMKEWAKIHNEYWIPDWNNYNQKKWGIEFLKENFDVTELRTYNVFVYGVVVKSKELAEQMLEEFRDRLYLYNEI